jgi:LysM repeat protein
MSKLSRHNELLLKIAFALLLLLYAWSAYDSVTANSSAYGAAGVCQVVYVSQGDSVWSIAAKYTSDKDDIRKLITAIQQLNGLNKDMAIYPGQALKIPAKATASR